MTFQKLHAGQQVCCTCTHYQQHYYRAKKQYREVYCGHCIKPRLKQRKPDQTCQLWTPIAPKPGSE